MSNTDYYKNNEDVIKHRNRIITKKHKDKRERTGLSFRVMDYPQH